MVKLRKSSAYKTGSQILLTFQLTQHFRDEKLVRSLIEYFDCGNVYKDKEAFHYRVEVFRENNEKIIPFFEKYHIIGVKASRSAVNGAAAMQRKGCCAPHVAKDYSD